MKRLIASILVGSLVLGSPGLSCYQAFAAQTKGPSAAAAVPMVPVAAGVQPVNATAGLASPTLGLEDASLGKTFQQQPAAVSQSQQAVGPQAQALGPAPAGEAASQAAWAMGENFKKNELIKDAAEHRLIKVGALSWLFDKLKRRSAAPETVAGKTSSAASGLSASEPSRTAGAAQVPAPQPKASRVKKFFGLSDFSSSETAYIAGQAVFIFGICVYMTSLPLLVQSLTGNASSTGVVRMVHYWTFGAASLFAGEVVKRSPMRRVLVTAGAARAVIYTLIGYFGLRNGLSLPGLMGLVGLNSLLVAHNHLVDIDAGGAAKVIADKQKRAKAFFLYKTTRYAMLLVLPWLLGFGMDALDKKYGAGTGAKAGFLVFASAMAATTAIYFSFVRVIGEEFVSLAERLTRIKAVFREMTGNTRQTIGRWAGRAVTNLISTGKTVLNIVLGTPPRIWNTTKVIWGNKTILARASMATLEQFIEDSLFMVVLVSFAVDILKAGNAGNGLILSATYAGGLLASVLLVKRAQLIQKKIGQYRFLAALSVGAALAFVPSIGFWIIPGLGVSSLAKILMTLPLVALMKILYDPIQSMMSVLLQNEIDEDPKARAEGDNIFSLITTLEVLAAGTGGLVFSWLFAPSAQLGFSTTGVSAVDRLIAAVDSLQYSLHLAVSGALGANAPMKVVTLALGGLGVLYLVGIRWIKGQLEKPTHKVHFSKEGLEAKALERLGASLKRMGLAPAKRITVDDPVSADRPTVAILSPASVYKLSIAQEGARQSPGDVHLALDPSWLIQEKRENGNRLLLKKGLYFDADGQAVLAEYRTPRPVRYFANFYTLGGNDRDDGVPLEENLDTPMSSSVQLEKITNDKLLTRLLLAAKGIAVPATVAFLMAAHPLLSKAAKISSADLQAQAVALPAEGAAQRAEIAGKIAEFLGRYQGAEVVIKPSGPRFHSGRGVKFFERGQIEAMIDHVVALSKDSLMTPDGAVLVDGRLTPPAIYLRMGEDDGSGTVGFLDTMQPVHLLSRDEIPGATPKQKKDSNFRVLAARTPWGGAVTTGIFARAGAWGIPTTSEPANPEDAAAVLSYETVIEAWRRQHGLLKTDAELAEFTAALEEMGAKALLALDENEKERARQDGEAFQAQTDYIGLDVMVELENGRLVPKDIEVNDQDGGGQWQLDLFHPKSAGAHSREWMATALDRARRDALKGKRIVVVGAGYEGKRFIFEQARAMGVKVILIDQGLTGFAKIKDRVRTLFGAASKDNWARGLVSEFIAVDTTERDAALAKAGKKLLRSARKNGKIDGITSFWEDDLPLTARLAQVLGLPYQSPAAADAVRSKFASREVMKAAGISVPRYALVEPLKKGQRGPERESKIKAFEAALEKVGFPAVLKPEFGAEQIGVKLVANKREALKAYAYLSAYVTPEIDPIFKHGTNLVLDQYLDGPEFDADIVRQSAQTRFLSITDNWPTRKPFFLATGSSSPSRALTPAQQALVATYVNKTADALGINETVAHIEGKIVVEDGEERVYVFDPNGRMGGHYVPTWNRTVWGRDFVADSFMIAAGIPVGSFKPKNPLMYLEGEFLIPHKSGSLTAFRLDSDARAHQGFFDLDAFKKVGDPVMVPPDGYERVGMLVAKGKNRQEALRHLHELRAQLVLDIRRK